MIQIRLIILGVVDALGALTQFFLHMLFRLKESFDRWSLWQVLAALLWLLLADLLLNVC